MTPNIDERLASIVRALNDVIMPALPVDAGLAREQAFLAIAHLSILRAQLDQAQDFERCEHEDAMRLAARLLQEPATGGDAATSAARLALNDASSRADGSRASRVNIHAAIAALTGATFTHGTRAARTRLSSLIVEHEAARALKDRRWFAAFGFDVPA